MDSHDKTISWFGTVRDKFDSFCSDVDHIISQDPFQYAENQLFTAGANVKQFCSEFMEEMLPENIINSLKEKTCGAVEQLRTDIDQGPIKELSDDSSPILMEIVENGDTDSSLGTETSVGKEMCFEEIRIRQTTFASEISRIDIHCRNGKCNGGDGLPQSPLTRPAKERGLSEHIDRPSADFKVELSTGQTPSALSTEERRASDLNDRSDDRKAEETENTHVAKADMEVQSFRTEMTDGKHIVLDSSKLCLIPDLPEENLFSQGTVCKFCLTMKFDKECGCKEATSSRDGDAESEQLGGESVWLLPLPRGKSDSAGQDFQESDWVIV